MSFSLAIQETFRGAPDAKTEQINMSGSFTFNDRNALADYINEDISKIHDQYRVLRKTIVKDPDQLTIKVLFDRGPNKHGRLLRKYTVIKWRRQTFEDDEFSLI